MSTIIGKELLPKGEELNDILSIVKEYKIQNYKMQIQKGSNVGDNYMGVIISVNIEEINSDKGKTLHLIVKYSPRSDRKDTLVDTNHVYRREIDSYTKYLPNLYHLQEKYNIKDGLLPVAKVYRTSTADSDEYLIMENMKMRGFQMHDKKTTLDFAHCKLILTQLGYLHGLGYVWKTKEGDKYQQMIEEYRNNIFENFGSGSYKEFFNSMIRIASNLFDPETESETHNKVKNLIDFGLDYYIVDINRADLVDDKYSVVIQGDCWNNNMLFKYDAENKPVEVCFLDWQVSRIVSPALELSYCIYLTTNTELRSNHFDDLIDIYYTALSNIIKECGLKPENLLPFSVLQEHINKYFGFGVVIACQNIPMILLDSKELGEFTNFNEILKENPPYFKINNDKNYIERIRGIILHGTERGFI